MKKNILYLLIFFLSSCALKRENQTIDIINKQFSEKIIKRGNNKMSVNLKKDNLQNILLLFYSNFSVNDILKILKIDKDTLDNRINVLVKNEYLKFKKDKYIPQIMIIPQAKGVNLYKSATVVSDIIVDSIVEILPLIENEYKNLSVSSKYTFKDLSFFLCSNILLDIGQLNNIEKLFLKSKRTLRNGNNYYFALLEKNTGKIEPFGLYGNQSLRNDTVYVGVYGNTRTTTNFEWKRYEKKEMPLFNKDDFNILFNKIPSLFTNSLINILENNMDLFEKKYLELDYQKSISFDEFFIWWYHFIYTDVTNKLEKGGYIKFPNNNLFYYQIEIPEAQLPTKYKNNSRKQ